MKYLKYFEQASAYEAYKNSEDYILPNVSFVKELANLPAGDPRKSVMFEPKPPVVFIQHINGNLYTTSQWVNNSFSNDLANGVAVVTNEASFVIAKEEFASVEWHPKSNFVEGVSYISVKSANITDYSEYTSIAREILCGKEDTDLIVAASNTGAAAQCRNYNFPNGNKGYLPSIGQLMIAFDYINDINYALALINGVTFGNKYYFSTTQEKVNTTTNTYNAFVAYPNNGSITPYSKKDVSWVNTRPFTML